jgi:predicted short-subunit dehydrogenase-like oxidoreductase (DUF2520 family)
MPCTLSIIGCGKVGKVLGRLWAAHQVFDIKNVLNSTIESARQATAFIDAGTAVEDYHQLEAADAFLIATPDDRIASSCSELANAGLLSSGTIVFHCSGALSSLDLHAAAQPHAAVASVHPIRSFASIEKVIQNFAGTYCGIEGDVAAVQFLEQAFLAIGAKLVPVRTESKTLYHAAAVFACNYLTVLINMAQQTYIEAGIPEEASLDIMEPLVRETINNIFALGPVHALTGPAARGDFETIKKQQNAVSNWDKKYGDLYTEFAVLAQKLADRKKLLPD